MKIHRGFISTVDLDEFHKTDLKMMEYLIFCYIRGFPDGVCTSRKFISDSFKIDPKTLRTIIRNLVKKGFVELKRENDSVILWGKIPDVKGKFPDIKGKIPDSEEGKFPPPSGKNSRQKEGKFPTNINNNIYNNIYYNKTKRKNNFFENGPPRSYDLDEYMKRAINDPLIYEKKEE